MVLWAYRGLPSKQFLTVIVKAVRWGVQRWQPHLCTAFRSQDIRRRKWGQSREGVSYEGGDRLRRRGSFWDKCAASHCNQWRLRGLVILCREWRRRGSSRITLGYLVSLLPRGHQLWLIPGCRRGTCWVPWTRRTCRWRAVTGRRSRGRRRRVVHTSLSKSWAHRSHSPHRDAVPSSPTTPSRRLSAVYTSDSSLH